MGQEDVFNFFKANKGIEFSNKEVIVALNATPSSVQCATRKLSGYGLIERRIVTKTEDKQSRKYALFMYNGKEKTN